MKKLYQKIIVSILSIAVSASVCAIAPVAANDTATEPAQMIWNEAYKPWWYYNSSEEDKGESKAAVNELVHAKSGDTYYDQTNEIGVTNTGNALFGSRTEYPIYFVEHDANGDRGGAYRMENQGDSLTIKLPTDYRENYKLYSAGIFISKPDGNTGEPIFDYYYSADDITYTKLTHSYTNTRIGAVHNQYEHIYNNAIKLPADAVYLKMERNATAHVDDGASSVRLPGVIGFTFGYVPTGADTIQMTANYDGDMTNFLGSGMVADGQNNFGSSNIPYYPNADDTTTRYFGLAQANGTTDTINAIDGYKITKVTMSFWPDTSVKRKVTLKLGDVETTAGGTASELSNLEIASEDGVAQLEIVSSGTAGQGNMFNIVITMEKIKLETSIDSAVDDGTKVTASATVSNLDLAEETSMELIIAGYDEDRFTGATTVTVYKDDADKTATLPIELPTGTKTVKVFLWKNLDTLVPVLDPIDAAVTTASAE